MGEPAATRPTKGRQSWPKPGKLRLNRSLLARWLLRLLPLRRIPREVPLTSSMAPFLANALRCSSAALADLKPRMLEISARVGGAPVLAMVFWMSSRISCCRAVSLGLSVMVSP
jgi:hypothetical protein